VPTVSNTFVKHVGTIILDEDGALECTVLRDLKDTICYMTTLCCVINKTRECNLCGWISCEQSVHYSNHLVSLLSRNDRHDTRFYCPVRQKYCKSSTDKPLYKLRVLRKSETKDYFRTDY
jgi:hypothetical protein